MTRLQHLVIFCEDVQETARFYDRLGLTRILEGEELHGPLVCFSDGSVNFTLLPLGDAPEDRRGHKRGFDHIGFVVDDVDATSANLRDGGAELFDREVSKEVRDSLAHLPARRTEVIFADPTGVPVELSSKPWPA